MWYTWYVENYFRRITCISRIYLPHANLFNLFNLLFIKYTCDTRDTWRMVSGVSQGSRGYICLTQICSIYLICCLYKIYMWYKWYVENGFQREIKIFFCEQSSPCDQQIHTTPLTQKIPIHRQKFILHLHICEFVTFFYKIFAIIQYLSLHLQRSNVNSCPRIQT